MAGLVHAYFGNGAGKTSKAVGLALRALGAGKRVTFIQFLKDGSSSEVSMLQKLEGISYKSTGTCGFIFNREPTKEEKAKVDKGIHYCEEAFKNGFDVVIVDEILNAYGFNIISEKKILSLIEDKPTKTELILTGRPCPKSIIDKCDYATEFVMVKHPYKKGIKARKGIDL